MLTIIANADGGIEVLPLVVDRGDRDLQTYHIVDE